MDLLKDLSIDKIRNAAEDALNQVKPKTDVEARVYEVLSHKNWGAASSIMNQIAQDTADYEKFAIITKITWENVETQRPSAWRVIFKGLGLIEHLVKNGSERCVDDARNHGHILRKLHQFNYYEGTIDRGLGVREKSKELVEILSDNDRVREERQKARKLREKFGGRAATASSSRNTGGGGYGNNSGWDSGGGGGGYGESGIDSGRSDNYNSGGARGRYDEDRGTAASSSEPTFAQAPTTKKKTTKKKKKAPAAVVAPAPAPEIDLFSFDDPSPAPAPPAASNDDSFSGFQSAGATTGGADPFGGDPFASAPANNNIPQQPAAADPFAAPSSQQSMGGAGGMNQMNDMFANMNTGGGMPQQGGMMGGANPMMNNNGMMGGANPMVMNNGGRMGGANTMMNNNGTMMGGNTPAPAPPADDDDFGDFEGAAGGQQASAPDPSDPFGSLVNLGGLSKNTKKEDKLNQPIVINAAAAQYMQDKQQGVGAAAPKDTSKSAAMSFAGIDGLPQMSAPSSMSGGMGMNGGMGMGMNGGMGMAPPPSAGMNPNVMGSAAGGTSAIDMMSPSAMAPPAPAQQQQQGGGMNPQQIMMLIQNPQMMQQWMATATPQQQQYMMQMVMMQQQMMTGQAQGGGNPGMMGGNNMMGGQGGGQMNGGFQGGF